ncbi:MAG: hypothetical protein O3A55_05280 [Bacteroidetes bacterium]|nr:hypothetical protein [Bacteroidota bacterium]
MNKNKFLIFSLILSLSVLLISCTTSAISYINQNHVEYATNRWTNTATNELSEGRTLYIQNCSGCHSLPKITDFNESKWIELIDEMSKEMKLADNDVNKIQKYVLTILNTSNKIN